MNISINMYISTTNFTQFHTEDRRTQVLIPRVKRLFSLTRTGKAFITLFRGVGGGGGCCLGTPVLQKITYYAWIKYKEYKKIPSQTHIHTQTHTHTHTLWFVWYTVVLYSFHCIPQVWRNKDIFCGAVLLSVPYTEVAFTNSHTHTHTHTHVQAHTHTHTQR